MVSRLLVRGMLAGLVAAVLAFVVARLFGEPQVALAIAFEERHVTEAEPELVSRAVQSGVGLATAIGLYGVAFGGLFALAFAFAYGRIGGFSPRAAAALVALGGFVTVQLVPFLKYPANPPAVGESDSIGQRSVLYFSLIVISLLAALLALSLGRRLASRLGNWNATLVAAIAFTAMISVVFLIMPSIDEVPADFPASLLWRFRLASIGMQAVLWSALGLGFGDLAERALRPAPAVAVGENAVG